MPSEVLGAAALSGSFEPFAETDMHMDFVLCTERLARLFEDQLHTLGDAVQKLVAAAAAEMAAAPMLFQRFELYQPDKSILVARFRVPDALSSLRKAVWRECRGMGVAFPDAMWMPHIKLGKLKGLSRGQLDKLSCSGLASCKQPPAAMPLGLTVFGEGGRMAEVDWTAMWSFSPEEAAAKKPPVPFKPPGRPREAGSTPLQRRLSKRSASRDAQEVS